MTYKEFMEWVETDKDLNKRFRRVLSEEIMEKGTENGTIILMENVHMWSQVEDV